MTETLVVRVLNAGVGRAALNQSAYVSRRLGLFTGPGQKSCVGEQMRLAARTDLAVAARREAPRRIQRGAEPVQSRRAGAAFKPKLT
jgi:hypothetical protein